MLKTLIASAALTASIFSPAATAKSIPVRTLHAHEIPAAGEFIGRGNATTVAYRATPGGPATTLADDGTRHTVPLPEAGCEPSVAQNGRLAYECAAPAASSATGKGQPRRFAVTRLDGSDPAFINVEVPVVGADGAVPGRPNGVGAQWISASGASYHGGGFTYAINWHTGELRDVSRLTPTLVADLNAPALAVPLCAPLKLVPVTPTDLSTGEPAFFPYVQRGAFVLISGDPGRSALEPTHNRLYKCGSSKPIALPHAFEPQALGDGWVARFAPVPHRSPRLELLRLRDGRELFAAGIPGRLAYGGELSFTAGHLYVHSGTGLYSVKLPRH
jgi:hypothetical protein